MPRANLVDHAELKRHGLRLARVEDVAWVRPGKRTRRISGWQLLDMNEPAHPEGDSLMIGDHGCIAPTEWEAVAEGLERIRVGLYEPIDRS